MLVHTLYARRLPSHSEHRGPQQRANIETALQKALRVPRYRLHHAYAYDYKWEYVYIHFINTLINSNIHTMFGLKRASHIPCKFGVQVPLTTKSLVKTGAPIRSIPERKGSFCAVRPATTGSQNQGENLIYTHSCLQVFPKSGWMGLLLPFLI